MPIPITREEYERKFGNQPQSPVNSNTSIPITRANYEAKLTQTKREQRLEEGKPVSVNPSRVDPTFFGGVARNIIKPFAKEATNIVRAGQDLSGQEHTQPFAGSYLGEVKPVGVSGNFLTDIKDSAGTGIEVGSNFIGGEGLGSVAKTGIRGLLKKSILTGTKEGALAGGLQQTGQSLEEDESLGGVLQSGAIGSLGGALFGGTLGAILPLGSKALTTTNSSAQRVKGSLMGPSSKLLGREQQNLKNALEDAFSEKATLRKKNEIASRYGTEPSEIFARYGAVPKVIDGKMDTSDIITGFDNAISDRTSKRKTVLKELSNVAPNVTATPLSDFESMVLKEIANDLNAKKTGLVSQYQNIAKNRFRDFENSYGNTLDLNALDDIRSGQGQLTKAFGNNIYEADASEYLARVARDLLDKKTENTGLSGVNKEVRDLINAKKIAEAMNHTPIKYGRFSQWMARMLGATIGANGVPVIGPLLGTVGGDFVLKSIQSNAFGGPLQRKILSYVGNNKEILDKLLLDLPKNKQELLMKEIKNSMKIPFLPAPREAGTLIRGNTNKAVTENIINLPAPKSATTYEAQAQKINREKSPSQLFLPPAPKNTSIIPGQTIRLPTSVRESNISINEIKNSTIKNPSDRRKKIKFLPQKLIKK